MIISVIIPFYNEFYLLNRAINSIFIQLEDNINVVFEVLIGNDGPYDNDTVVNQIEVKYRDSIIIIISKHPKGPGAARNCVLDIAKGELIAFLDSDDYWLKGKISSQINLYKNGFNFIATSYQFDSTNLIIYPPNLGLHNQFKVFKYLGLGTSTLLIASELIKGMRFRDFRFCQDIDFWYRLSLSKNFSYASVNKSLVVYSTSGSTKNKLVQAIWFWEVMSQNKVVIPLRLYYLARYAARGFLNHLIPRFVKK